MKKRAAFFLALQFSLFLLAGCDAGSGSPGSVPADTDTSVQTETESAETEKGSSQQQDTKPADENAYKQSCMQYDYREISRYPSDYEGEDAYFRGYVRQVLEDGNDVQLLVDVTENDYGWDDSIIVWYTRQSADEARILEEDIVELWGELEGLYTYESLIGESITVPCMTAKYVSFFEDTTLSGDDAPEVSGAAAKTEDELLSQIETASGYTVQDYIYVDMDCDGASEMIGGFFNSDYMAEFWYCSSDGQECSNLNLDTGNLPYFSMNYISYNSESHVVINTYPEVGSGYFTILAKRKGKIYALCEKNWGNVKQVGQEITVTVDNSDAYYDADMGWNDGQASEETYIYYNGITYHEYPAVELTETELFAYRDADLYPGIGFTPPSELQLLRYYERENGYIYYQFGVRNTDTGNINYFYYKYRLVNGQVVPVTEGNDRGDGVIQEYLTDLDG